MKIQQVNYTNFRNVPDGTFELKGRDVILLADNARGKSNFMNGLLMAFNAIKQTNVIRDGAEKAEVKVLCAQFEGEQPIEGTEHTFRMKAWTAKDGSEKISLEVKLPSGESYDTKTAIGQVAGELRLEHDFVSLSKTPEGKRRQIEIVKSYMDQETIQALDREKNKMLGYRKERTEVGREVDQIKGFIQTQGMDRKLIEDNASRELVDTNAISAQIAEVGSHNARIVGVRDRIKQRYEDMSKINTEIRNLELKIEQLKAEFHEKDKQNNEAEAFLKATPEKDDQALRADLDRAIETNKIIERAKTLKTQVELLAKQEQRYGELTAMIESGEQAISDAIKDLTPPIPGLSFDDECIRYNGKVVDTDHLSKGEIMLIEAMLRISKHPNVGALFIGEAESLGTEFLKEICSAAHEAKMHVIMEQVDRGREELTLQFIPEA
jgi:recombinational DNA repair ATPase RecF